MIYLMVTYNILSRLETWQCVSDWMKVLRCDTDIFNIRYATWEPLPHPESQCSTCIGGLHVHFGKGQFSNAANQRKIILTSLSLPFSPKMSEV